MAKIVNRKTGLAIYTTLRPGHKKPNLIIADEVGYKIVATFTSTETADIFMEHMASMLKARVLNGKP